MTLDPSFERTLTRERAFFATSEPVTIARAPGRLDLMGGIADYSGSLVLQWPIALAAHAAAQWQAEPIVTVRTTSPEAAHGAAEVSVALADLVQPYASVRDRFSRDPASRWAAYIAGAVTVLHHERGLVCERGVRWLIASDVPAGKGVSSSASIEVAALTALSALSGPPIGGRELALLCQRVENLVVGAPCGVMDQMTAACGQANALLALLCQPAEVEPFVELPRGIEVVGIDSGIRHAVSGADYGSVRVGAFMGYRIVAELAGLRVTRDEPGRVSVEDPRWHGYLANIGPEAWERSFRARVPERLSGAEFLAAYGGFTDPVTTIDPARTYAVRQPCAHPIYEHDRVTRFRALLETGASDEDTLGQLGDLMYASHESYNACGLGSAGTDEIVRLVRAAGPAHGLFGAKITGGGSGGTVAVVARSSARAEVERVAREYAALTGRAGSVLAGSSDGAARTGTSTRQLTHPGD